MPDVGDMIPAVDITGFWDLIEAARASAGPARARQLAGHL
jgi:hypothetical protein